MKWFEYEALAFRTNANLGNTVDNNTHMVSGMITEMGELIDAYKKNLAYGREIDIKNVKEEVGDFLWYVAGFVTFNPLYREMVSSVIDGYKSRNISKELNCSNLVFLTSGTFSLGNFAHDAIYSEATEMEMQNLFELLDVIIRFCVANGFDIHRIMENNIEKLRARYPERFTAEKAINRDLDLESQILDE